MLYEENKMIIRKLDVSAFYDNFCIFLKRLQFSGAELPCGSLCPAVNKFIIKSFRPVFHRVCGNFGRFLNFKLDTVSACNEKKIGNLRAGCFNFRMVVLQ